MLVNVKFLFILILTFSSFNGSSFEEEKEVYEISMHQNIERKKLVRELPESISRFDLNFESLKVLKDIEKDNHQMYLLAKIIHCELSYKGEEYLDDKTAVGIVILNRVLSDRFPNSVEEVIFQPRQFSPISDGRWYSNEPTELDYLAAKQALDYKKVVGDNGQVINEAVFFMNPAGSSEANRNWFKRELTYLDKIGQHEFYAF